MQTPKYLLDKIARHGSSIQRLQQELINRQGEFSDSDDIHAIAFDAADFVWSFLLIQGYREATESREIRNKIGQYVSETLRSWPLTAVGRLGVSGTNEIAKLVELISNLDAAVIRHFGVSDRSKIDPEECEGVFKLDAYSEFVRETYRLGFVPTEGMEPTFPIWEANKRPEQILTRGDFGALHSYLYTLLRAENGNDGNASPVLCAIQSGALPLLGERLADMSVPDETVAEFTNRMPRPETAQTRPEQRIFDWIKSSGNLQETTTPLQISTTPSSDDHIRWAGRVLAMVHELHKVGYQRIRIAAGWSPSGCHWRCHITHAANVQPNGWEPINWDRDVAMYTTGHKSNFFEWTDGEGKNARQLAQMFLERFPDIAAKGLGRDTLYAGWFVNLLGSAESGRLPVFFADNEIELVESEVPPPLLFDTEIYPEVGGAPVGLKALFDERPSLGNPVVLEGLVRSYLKGITDIRRDYHLDKIQGDEAIKLVTDAAQKLADILMGKNANYASMILYSPLVLGQRLVKAGWETDPETACFKMLFNGASRLTDAMAAYENGEIDEDVAKFRSEIIVDDTLEYLLGYQVDMTGSNKCDDEPT